MSRVHPWAIAATFVAAVTGFSAAPSPMPAPADVIGFEPCADRTLATSEQITEYFRALDRASERMTLVEMGTSSEGRPQLMAVISSETNLRDLPRYQDISRRLARATDLSPEQAGALAAEGRAVVWIDFGLHSTEVAHAQTAPLLAYKVVSEDSEEMRFIRDNVIFLLAPDLNPDGTTLVATWYRRHVGTPYEETSPPVLYQKYAGHDNNRDWFMFNLPESQNAATQLYTEWLPQIVYDQHQSAPFPARIFVPPFDDPMNPRIPALVMRGVNLVGDAIARRLDQEGKSGAISRLDFDTWWNGGMRTAPYFHNMIGILTETAHASATPATYDPERFAKTFEDGRPTLTPSTYYPNPYRGGEWHLRDSCDYMVTASMAVLDIGARRRREWLHDIYRMGRDAIDAGSGETYVVPAGQWDDGTAVRMINALRWGGVDVERATRPFRLRGRSFAPGSFIIKAAQPFRPYLTDLLNPQEYPDLRAYPGGPPEPPYDITGWTLPLQMGVEVARFTAVDSLDEAGLVPVEWAAPLPSTVPDGSFAGYLLDPRPNGVFTAVNRLLEAGVAVLRSIDPITAGGRPWPPGAFFVGAGPDVRPIVTDSVAGLGLTVAGLDRMPSDQMMVLARARIGLYKAWGGNPDEGWTRWVFEAFEFPYDTLEDGDLRAGALRNRYDVIVLPDASYARMLSGLSSRAAPPEYTGGMTPRGVSSLYEFVDRGGTLVALDSAAELPLVVFGLGVRDVTANRRETEYYVPGALLRLQVDPTHPVGFGLPHETAAFLSQSPAFSLESDAAADPDGRATTKVVAWYPDDNPLLSGWLLGGGILQKHAAVVETRVGQGRVVLIGFRAQHRGQSHATFKFLFNAVTLGGAAVSP